MNIVEIGEKQNPGIYKDVLDAISKDRQGRISLANEVARLDREKFDAYLTAGFDHDQALQLLIASMRK